MEETKCRQFCWTPCKIILNKGIWLPTPARQPRPRHRHAAGPGQAEGRGVVVAAAVAHEHGRAEQLGAARAVEAQHAAPGRHAEVGVGL